MSYCVSFNKKEFLKSARRVGAIIRESEALEAMAENKGIAQIVLQDYYNWCKENGIEKGSVKRFAKERGILLS